MTLRTALQKLGLTAWGSLEMTYRIQGIIIGILITLICLALMGCGSTVRVDPGTAAVSQYSKQTVSPDGTVVREQRTGGESKGAGGAATGDKTDLNVDPAPSPVDLPGTGGAAIGGGGGILDSDRHAFGRASADNPIVRIMLIILGALFCAAGGACLYFGIKDGAMAGFGIGGAFIVAGLFPALVLWTVIGGIVVGAGFFLYTIYQRRQVETKAEANNEALRAVVAGVENLPDASRLAAKSKIAEHATPADTAVIAEVKKEDGFSSERAPFVAVPPVIVAPVAAPATAPAPPMVVVVPAPQPAVVVQP